MPRSGKLLPIPIPPLSVVKTRTVLSHSPSSLYDFTTCETHTHTSFDQHFLASVPGVSWQKGSFLGIKWRVQNKSVFRTSATASSRVLTIPA